MANEEYLLGNNQQGRRRGSVSSYPREQRKPLIDYCTNPWQATRRSRSRSTSEPFYQTAEHGNCFEYCLAILKTPKIRRQFSIFLFISLTSLFFWFRNIYPYILESRAAWASLSDDIAMANGGRFGVNIRPQFPDLIQIETLDSKLVPRPEAPRFSDHKKKRRLIFVGDVHGCKDELDALLAKVQFDPKTDHLVTTGDLISKGPDSLGVIDLVRGMGASCVRGNHEDRIILVADDLRSASLRGNAPDHPGLGHLGEQAYSPSDIRERELALSLNSDQLNYLKSCPVILRIGEMKALGGQIVVVHGGLVPAVALERQDPGSVMNMRVIDLSTHVPSKDENRQGSIPWTTLWNKYQKLKLFQTGLFPSKDKDKQNQKESHTTVIYGHDSKRGLQIEKYTKGLDTGCVKGGKLSALVLSDGGKQNIVQVKCKDYRPSRALSAEVDDILRHGKPVDREDLESDFDEA